MSAPSSERIPDPQSKVVLSSLEGVVQLLISRPELQRIPALSGLAPLATMLQSRGPGCGSCSTAEMYARYRPYFAASLRGLTTENVAQMKKILNVAQVCFYKNDQAGNLEKVCL